MRVDSASSIQKVHFDNSIVAYQQDRQHRAISDNGWRRPLISGRAPSFTRTRPAVAAARVMLKERRAASGRAKREPLDDLLEVVGLPQAGLRFCSTDKSPDANALAIAAPPSHATAFAYPVAPLVWKSGTRHVLTGG